MQTELLIHVPLLIIPLKFQLRSFARSIGLLSLALELVVRFVCSMVTIHCFLG